MPLIPQALRVSKTEELQDVDMMDSMEPKDLAQERARAMNKLSSLKEELNIESLLRQEVERENESIKEEMKKNRESLRETFRLLKDEQYSRDLDTKEHRAQVQELQTSLEQSKESLESMQDAMREANEELRELRSNQTTTTTTNQSDPLFAVELVEGRSAKEWKEERDRLKAKVQELTHRLDEDSNRKKLEMAELYRQISTAKAERDAYAQENKSLQEATTKRTSKTDLAENRRKIEGLQNSLKQLRTKSSEVIQRLEEELKVAKSKSGTNVMNQPASPNNRQAAGEMTQPHSDPAQLRSVQRELTQVKQQLEMERKIWRDTEKELLRKSQSPSEKGHRKSSSHQDHRKSEQGSERRDNQPEVVASPQKENKASFNTNGWGKAATKEISPPDSPRRSNVSVKDMIRQNGNQSNVSSPTPSWSVSKEKVTSPKPVPILSQIAKEEPARPSVKDMVQKKGQTGDESLNTSFSSVSKEVPQKPRTSVKDMLRNYQV